MNYKLITNKLQKYMDFILFFNAFSFTLNLYVKKTF